MVEAIVEFDYKAQEADELSIRKGDKISDVKTLPGGWWEGTLSGKRGMFPDNFVKITSKQESGNNMKGTSNTDVTMRTGGGRKCKVLYSYQPANEDELQLTVNDIINVIAEVEDGWWRGSLRDMEGVFPSNFVTEIFGEEPRRPRPGSRDEATRVADSESDCDRSTSVSSPDSSQLLDSSVGKSEADPEVPSLPPKPVKEQCRVLFPYEAANADELTLKEGDVVNVVSRDVQDKGWWRGELRGRVGLFPDNFVELLAAAAAQQEEEPPAKPDRLATAKQPLATTNRARDTITKPPGKSEASPPVPGKKPPVSLPGKKSERVAIVGPFDDVTDGAAPSRASRSIDPPAPAASDFDSVARAAMLTHPTAGRVKAPSRRPPTALAPKEADAAAAAPRLTNGTSTENVTTAAHDDAAPGKKVWEKAKAPWMEELKLNQARKSVSPEQSKPVSVRNSRPQSMYSGDISGLARSGSSPTKPGVVVPPTKVGSPPTKTNNVAPTKVTRHSPVGRTAIDVGNHSEARVTTAGNHVEGNSTVVTKSHSFRSEVTSHNSTNARGDSGLVKAGLNNSREGGGDSVGELRAAVTKLTAMLEQQREHFTRSLNEVVTKLNEESQKRVQLEVQLNKLTDLVTQV